MLETFSATGFRNLAPQTLFFPAGVTLLQGDNGAGKTNILEGIALEQRLHTGGVEAALQRPVEQFIVVGGGARSPLWRQIIADVTGKPVYPVEVAEASSLGAGILAAAGSGLFPGVKEAAQAMAASPAGRQPEVPDPARQAFYSRLYDEV